MKKLRMLPLLLVFALLITPLFCSCKKENAPGTDSENNNASTEKMNDAGFVTFVIRGEEEKQYRIGLENLAEGGTVYDVLTSKEYKEVFMAEISISPTAFLTGLAGLVPDANAEKMEYIAFYTTDINFSFGEAVDFGGISYYYTNGGIQDVVLRENESYLFCLESMPE